MSKRKPVLPELTRFVDEPEGRYARKIASAAELRAAEAVIRACRKSRKILCKDGCDCICCIALDRLDRVTGKGSK